jgi:hypothetical protein
MGEMGDTMTGRTYRRQRAPRVLYAVAIVLVLLVVGRLAAHLLGVLVLVAAAGYGGYLAGQRSRPVAKATISAPDPAAGQLRAELHAVRGQLADARRALGGHDAETARLRAELADTRAALGEARASATAAWDQAASRPPRRLIGDTAPMDALDAERLAQTPMSGARSLFGGDRP